MRHIRYSALLLALAATPLSAANRLGDANNDHAQDMADAALVQAALYGSVSASAVSPLALADNDSTLDLGDLLYVAQIATGGRANVPVRPALLTGTSPAPATYPHGTLQTITYGVASNYPAATKVSGMDGFTFAIVQAGIEST